MAHEIVSSEEVKGVLTRAKVIAVLGAHHESFRPAHYVPAYLHEVGYRVIPVNPELAGRTLWGERVRASLAEIKEPVDVVDVFRRSAILPTHLHDILAMDPRPRVVWLQSGIENDAFTADLVAAGIDVVQDRCTLADHRRFGLR